MLDETLSLSSYAYKKNTKAGRRSSKVKGANQPLIDSSSSLHQSRNLLLLQIHLSLKKMKSSSPKCIPVVSTFASPFDVTPPSSDSTRKPLSLWPGMYHSPVTSLYGKRGPRSSSLSSILPKTHLLRASFSQGRPHIAEPPSSTLSPLITSSASSTEIPGTRSASGSCSKISTLWLVLSPSRYIYAPIRSQLFLHWIR